MLCRQPYAEDIGREALFAKKRDAIAAIFERLDPDVCAGCKARIFEECARRPLRQ
jgi:SulP family sulfate permease